jgi:predicted phosphate transport protein (TIGR00153 family)
VPGGLIYLQGKRSVGMKLFFQKSPRFIEMIDAYLRKVFECMELFREALLIHMEQGDNPAFQKLVVQVKEAESSADRLRREIELTLYERALIPESRGDVLGILEAVDKIPNRAESVVFQLETESLRIPEPFKAYFLQLVEINFQTYEDICQAIKAIFRNIKDVRKFTAEVGRKESSSDAVERELIRKIFRSQIPTGEKILLKELVIELGNISDKAEDAADRLNIMAAKRLI